MPGEQNSKNKSRNLFIAVVISVIAIAGLIGGMVWFMTRPENLEVVQSDSDMSSLSLVKVGEIDEGLEGTVRVDSSFLLDNPSNVTYYLTINVTDGFPSNSDIVDFYFTEEQNSDGVPSSSVVVQDVESVQYPYKLGSSFEPSLWRGGVFVERATSALVGSVPFTVDLTAQEQEEGTTSAPAETSVPQTTFAPSATSTAAPTPNPTIAPTDPPTPRPTSSDPLITNSPVAPTSMPTLPPTQAPTMAPTQAPTTPPTPAPTSSPPPPSSTELVSQLSGVRGYRVGGSITITTRTDFVNGVGIVDIPVLRFRNIQVPSAPGPFLYITTRPNVPNTLTGEDLRIPIRSIGDGSFTLEGNFEQDFVLPDGMNVADYDGGSWIVWCDPFSILLGGGQISSA